MGRGWLGAVVALLAWGGAVPGARAADPVVELATPSVAPLEVALKRGVPGLLAEIRLRNTGKDAAQPRTVRPGPTLLRDTDGLARPATWTRLDGAGTAIAPGGGLVLQLAASLPEPGVYEVWIDTFAAAEAGAAAQPDRRVRVLVTREAVAVPADLLLAPKPMHLARWPWTRKARTTLVEMANATGKPIEFARPALLGVGLASGDAATLASAGRMPVLDAGNCQSPLAAGGRCALRLTVGGGWAPGQYAVDVGVAGMGGGFSVRTVPISVRLPLWAPILITALGVAAGSLVQAWRSSGRRAVSGLIDLGLLRTRVAAIEKDAGLELKGLTAPILDTIATLEARARSGTDAAAEIAALGLRVGRLAGFASVELAYRKLVAEGRAMLAAPHTRYAQQAVAAVSGQAADGLDVVEATMASLVNDWPGLAAKRAEAAALVTLLGRLRAPGSPAEAAQAALQAALAASVAPLAAEAGATAVADRVPPLQTAIEAARQAADEAAKAQAKALVPTGTPRSGVEAMPLAAGASPAAPTGFDLPTAVAFDLTASRTPRSLERQRLVLEWGTNLIILAALSLSGAVLVGGNASWGAPLDVIALLLAGFGSRVVIDSLALQAAPAAVVGR